MSSFPGAVPPSGVGGSAALNADLHCHSTVSDGTLAPEELAERARAAGVELWALTDHDEIGGQALAQAAADSVGLEYVPGVEISVTWAGQTIHIVGLNIDPDAPVLRAGLVHVRSGRARRAQEIGARLAAAGIPGAFEGALRYVSNPNLISRTHFARFLVENGVRSDVSSVFADFLIAGKPGYVPVKWADLEQALAWIEAAGGVAVVAHPGRYRFSQTERDAFLDRFKELGGEGIEVVTGSHTEAQYREYAELARRYGFHASRGSDFHSPEESRVELGALPPLPSGLTPVWELWR